jgi:hypothetical protein
MAESDRKGCTSREIEQQALLSQMARLREKIERYNDKRR